MSLYTPETCSFELPENPVPNGSLDAIAHEALDWIETNIPLTVGSPVCRPEIVGKRDEKWNCYAQAIGGVALLSEWGISSGIVQRSDHAFIVAGKDKQIRFIDPARNSITTPSQEAERLHGSNIGRLYQSELPKALGNGNFVHYYYLDSLRTRTLWRSFNARAIRGATQHIRGMSSPHIIVDAATGIDMLLACADLERYSQDKPEKFKDEYDHLIGWVPDFKNPGANQGAGRPLIHV